jgi:uncharacterized RDD family membrane protein YckC
VTGLRHCPNGDGAFEAWVANCLDCGAELVDAPPPPPPPVDHSVTELEIVLTEEERSALQLLLTGDDISHEWHGSVLRVPSVNVARVAERIAWVRRAGEIANDAPIRLEPPVRVDTELEWFDAPGFWQRGLGALLDSAAAGLVAFVGAAVTGSTGQWIGATFIAVHQVVFVSLRGQTLGKRLVGTRVANLSDGGTPDLRQAIVRWLAWGGGISIIDLVVHLPLDLPALASVAVVLPILKPPYHRGLHDLAARTIVTKA